MIIFTDASYSEQTGVAGFGFVIVDKKFDFRAGNFVLRKIVKDNNVAEVGAIREALRFCQGNRLFQRTEDRTLTVISDSKVAVARILENQAGVDDYEKDCLAEIHQILKTCPLTVHLFQIKGHSQQDQTKFSQLNQVADVVAADYRYLGEIQQEKERLQTFAVVQNLKNKKKKRR